MNNTCSAKVTGWLGPSKTKERREAEATLGYLKACLKIKIKKKKPEKMTG